MLNNAKAIPPTPGDVTTWAQVWASDTVMVSHAVFDLAAQYGAELGLALRPHDLRRTCAKLCRKHNAPIEQIQLLLGHASIETTQTYLGTTLDLENAPNDHLGLEWRND